MKFKLFEARIRAEKERLSRSIAESGLSMLSASPERKLMVCFLLSLPFCIPHVLAR
jgi:hypothetical protein